jgi:hypothetical protein
MSREKPEPLKTISFEDELLPTWACLLDLAARLAPVNSDTRRWFAKFIRESGTEDSRVIADHCTILLAAMAEFGDSITSNLARERTDAPASQILAAWKYTLETIRQCADARETCSWIVPFDYKPWR